MFSVAEKEHVVLGLDEIDTASDLAMSVGCNPTKDSMTICFMSKKLQGTGRQIGATFAMKNAVWEKFKKLISETPTGGYDPDTENSYLQVGDKVNCRWKQGSAFFPGTIAAVDGEWFKVNYDDGDVEWTTCDFFAAD